MTDYGPDINPITEAWERHPEARCEFVREVLMARYRSMAERCIEQIEDRKEATHA